VRRGTITILYSGTDECGNLLEQTAVITVLPAAVPTLTIPTFPTELSCAGADGFTTPADGTYSNGESGDCEISGAIPPQVTESWTACDGGTITILYSGTDECGNLLEQTAVITVLPAAVPTLTIPTFRRS